MAEQPSPTGPPPTSPSDLLDTVTRFSVDLGSMTELGPLGARAIEELCRVTGSSHGALYILDKEHDCYRRGGTVGTTLTFPLTLPLSHPLATQASTFAKQEGGHVGLLEDSTSLQAKMAMSSMNVVDVIPHVSRGRTIAFSLLDAGHDTHEQPRAVRSLLAALAQTTTNAIDTFLVYEDLHRSHLLMKRTDRLKSLETIAGGFAHEIRNPLTSIKTFIQLAPERKDDPDFIREFSRIVLDDVYRIERLIEEILDYARYMEPKLTEEDINDIVSSCLYFIDVKADSRGIKIEKELASDLPRVMLDRQQIKQVFLNLFLNALDAMSEGGGVLRVRTRALKRADGKTWVQIETEDTGLGIPEANLEHIFDPFFTTKHESGEHEGTGLGLTIVHQIVQEHHGEIKVQSTLGQGTMFLVNLPALSL